MFFFFNMWARKNVIVTASKLNMFDVTIIHMLADDSWKVHSNSKTSRTFVDQQLKTKFLMSSEYSRYLEFWWEQSGKDNLVCTGPEMWDQVRAMGRGERMGGYSRFGWRVHNYLI